MLKLSESFGTLNQMTIRQLANTLNQIRCAEHISFISGSLCHLIWLIRRVFGFFPVELKISSSRLHVGEHNSVAALVNSMDVYDFNNMNAIKLLLARYGDGIFFDIGANIGTYTLVASEVPSAKVISFEPHPETFKELKRNVALNQRANVTLLNIAVSDHNRDVFLTNCKPGLSSLNRILPVAEGTEDNILVASKTLDWGCNDLCTLPNIVKIDTEGHELKVFLGFQESINAIDILLIENGESNSIRNHLESLGLLGPFWFHFAQKAFLSVAQKKKEDAIYVSASFKNNLEEFGFSVSKI